MEAKYGTRWVVFALFVCGITASTIEKRGKQGLTQKERDDVLDLHNYLRQQQRASNMQTLEWNYELENVAQDLANTCVFKHSSTWSTASFENIGENIAAWTALNLTGEVMRWYNEVKDYDYNSNYCSRVCGHYTQVVWADTNKVGCGVKHCPSLTIPGRSPLNAYFFVCNYAPAGNWHGVKPYKT